MVNKARLVESMANLVKDKRIDGITNIQDHSSREGMRIVVDIRRDATRRSSSTSCSPTLSSRIPFR